MSLVIDVETALWIVQGAASILVASRSATLRPSMGLALGCRVSADRTALTAFMAVRQNHAVLADLREGRALSVVFTNSTSLRALQFKAEVARLVPLEPGDIERMNAHTGALVREWSQVGQPEAFTRALHARDPADTVMGVRFSPYLAFDQTPGPRAGMPLLGGT